MAKPSRKKVAKVDAPWLTRDSLWALVLLVAVIVTYQPVWHAGFVWDDDGRVTANPCIVGPLGLKEIWTTSAADLCPLVYTTFWVEHALWGLTPLPYHLVNVFLHGVCAILLWRVLRLLTVPGAWLGAALWALHPVQVETVAWVTEMKNTQSGVFYLLTILFFILGLQAGAREDRRGERWNQGLSLLCAALALASKSSTVVLPIILGLCAWWMEGRWRWRNLPLLGIIALMAIFPSALTLWTQKLLVHGVGDLQYARSFPERLATAGDAVWFYLGKLAWPHPLIFIYPRWTIDAGSWIAYLPLLAVLLTLGLFWLKRESWARPWFFAFAYFVGALLPVLGLIDGYFWRYSLVGDHFQYLASMGPLAFAGAGIVKLGELVSVEKVWLRPALCSGLLAILGVLSWQRSWVYENVDALWTDTLARNPGCWMAYTNRGNDLLKAGQLDPAMVQFRKALEFAPGNVNDHTNLGIALMESGRTDEALPEFQRATQISPDEPETHINLGHALQQKGEADAAIGEFQKATEIDPTDIEAHNYLGIALARRGDFDKAIAQFQDVVRLKPDDAKAQSNLETARAMAQRKAAPDSAPPSPAKT